MNNFIRFDTGRISKDLIYDFFTYFSRIEAVWKSYDYYNWKRSSLKIVKIADDLRAKGLDYLLIINHSENIKYLCEEPPKKQIGSDDWEDYSLPNYIQNLHSIEAIVDKMRNVRNNLFHGGKWSSLENNDTRDMKLMLGSLEFIKLILEKHDDWRLRFNTDPF